MKFNPQQIQKLKTLFVICVISICAGILFQYINEGFVDYNAFVMGVFIGLGFGIFELFFMRKINNRIKSYPLALIILINITFYTLIVFLVSAVIGFLVGSLQGRKISEFYNSLFGPQQFYLILYAVIIFTVIIFFMQVNRLLGKGILLKLLLARYHKPTEEDRIIMFLDLSSSSEIAEKLTPHEYSSFLRDFFLDLDDAIIETRGTVFQYVGDEVVILWNVKEGILNNNCIHIFFLAKEIISLNREKYLKKYGVLPKFKAGIHYGKIVITEIGGSKQEIAYHGDTINTAARIRSTCSIENSEFLASAELITILPNIDNDFNVTSIGVSNFKGKKNVIGLFKVETNNN